MLHSDNAALQYLNSQTHLNRQHAGWVSYLQEFTFSIKHKSGRLNKVADALSRRLAFLNTMSVELEGIDQLNDYYVGDPDFDDTYLKCEKQSQGSFHLQDGFLF